MEFKKYDSREHDGVLSDRFSEASKTPETIDQYKGPISQALKDVENVFGVEADFEVVIAETDRDFLTGKFDETPYWAQVGGMSHHPDYKEIQKPTIFLRANSEYDYWKSGLKYTFVHEENHQEYYLIHDDFGWTVSEALLFEGLAMNAAEKIGKLKNYNWSVNFDKPDLTTEEVENELGKEVNWPHRDQEDPSHWFEGPDFKGYSLAYHLVDEVLQRKNENIDNLMRINSERWQKQIGKSIEHILKEK